MVFINRNILHYKLKKKNISLFNTLKDTTIVNFHHTTSTHHFEPFKVTIQENIEKMKIYLPYQRERIISASLKLTRVRPTPVPTTPFLIQRDFVVCHLPGQKRRIFPPSAFSWNFVLWCNTWRPSVELFRIRGIGKNLVLHSIRKLLSNLWNLLQK